MWRLVWKVNAVSLSKPFPLMPNLTMMGSNPADSKGYHNDCSNIILDHRIHRAYLQWFNKPLFTHRSCTLAKDG